MASFLERKEAQFSPYDSQLPDNYAQLGMIKQGQYDEGVRVVENYFSNLSGLDVIRQADQQYLNEKIAAQQSEVNKTAGSVDWSSRTMQNKVGAMAAKIYADPNIQNAVSGTMQYKKMLSDITEAKKSGKGYSVQNEWDSLSSVQPWLSDTTPGARYSGKNYTPYVDVNDKVLKYFKDKKPNWTVEINPMAKFDGGDGVVAYAMVENKKEYIDPSLVKRELFGILQPEDYNQLGINGRYDKRYYSDPVLFEQSLERDQKSIVGSLQAQITSFRSEAEKNQDNPRALQQINGYISQLEKQVENTNRSYNTYRTGVQQGNMEGVKSSMYTDNYLDQWASNLGYTKEEINYKESPLFKSIMDQRKAESDHQKNLLDMEKTKAEIDKLNAESEYTRLGKPKRVGSKNDSEGVEDEPTDFIPQPIPNETAQNLSRNYMGDTEVLAAQVGNEKYKMLYDNFLKIYNGDEAKLATLFNVTMQEGQAIVRPKKGKENEIDMAYETLKSTWQQNPSAVTPSVRNAFSAINNQELIVKARREKMNQVVSQANQRFNLDDVLANRPQNININLGNGVRHSYTPQDLLDFNSKLEEVVSYVGSRGEISINPERAAQLITSPKDQFAFNTFVKSERGEPLNTAETGFINNLQDTRTNVVPLNRDVIRNRRQFIDQNIQNFTQFERSYTESLPTAKPEFRRATTNTIQRLYNVVAQSSGVPSNLPRKTLTEYIEDENTVYELEHMPGGMVQAKISNPAVSKEIKTLTIEPAAARSLGFSIEDPLRDIRQLMGINRTATGGSYTGRNFNDALQLANPALQKYSVKYNINQDSSGAFNVDLFVYDKNSSQWVTSNSPITKSVANLESAYEFLNNKQLDNAISTLLKPKDGTK